MTSRVSRGIALPFLDRGIRSGEWSTARPNRTLTSGKTRYPLYRRLGGPQGQSGRAENLALPGFDPRTVPLVVSRYTDWATWPCNIVGLSYMYRGAGKSLARSGRKRLTEHLKPKRNWLTWASSVLITHPILRIWPLRTTTCSLDWKKMKGK
jgi:hypothetical protein